MQLLLRWTNTRTRTPCDPSRATTGTYDATPLPTPPPTPPPPHGHAQDDAQHEAAERVGRAAPGDQLKKVYVIQRRDD